MNNNRKFIKRFIVFALFLILTSVDIDFSSLNSTFSSTITEAQAKKRKKYRRTKKRKKRVKKFTLNFKNVEITEFLNIMSQLIGKNIIVGNKVRGKITISSSKKVPVSQAYNIMKSILEVKGLAIIETKNLIKVITVKDAIQKNIEVIIDGKRTRLKAKDKTITFLLEIQNAEAQDIANSLKKLKTKDTTIVIYKPLNTLIISGKSDELNGLVKIAKALDKEIKELEDDGSGKQIYKGYIHVYHLENANAEDLAGVLSRIPFSATAKINTSPIVKKKAIRSSRRTSRVTKTQGIRRKNKSKLSIIANKDTNSLIITASPDEYKEIIRVVKKLDIVREQVLIEAIIVEVGAESGWGFGIDWMLGQQFGTNLFGGSSIMGAPNYSNMTMNGKQLVVPFTQGALQLGFMSDISILSFALLNASGTDSNFNILSTPQILTVDNHEAEINVGEEIAIATNNRISESGTQFYTYDYKSVGVKLKITPHITKGSQITLDLYQEINSVIGSTVDPTGSVPPTLSKRDIKTKIIVMDGKTIVVGGLISNQKSVTETKVPILGDIPILGWLFKHKSVSYSKKNLLVFITPHIVTKQKDIDRITRQKRNMQHRLK